MGSAGGMGDEEFDFDKFMEEQANIPPPDGRECWEALSCPACDGYDVDFELIEYRLVECSLCQARVRVTHYEVSLGQPGDDTKWPIDHVTYRGVVAAASPATAGAASGDRRSTR